MKTRQVIFTVDVPDHVTDSELEEVFASAVVDGMPVMTGWWIDPRLNVTSLGSPTEEAQR